MCRPHAAAYPSADTDPFNAHHAPGAAPVAAAAPAGSGELDTHFAYSANAATTTAATGDLDRELGYLVGVDPSSVGDEWLLRAAGPVPVNGLTSHHKRVARIVERHGTYDGGEATYLTAPPDEPAPAPGPAPQPELPDELDLFRTADPTPPDPAADPAGPVPSATPAGTAARRFRPCGQADLAPSGEMARIRANLAALRTLRTIQAEARPATADEQAVLARWSGWGAVPAALDETKTQFAWVRQELAELLDAREMAAARRTVINAHYTDAALVEAIWEAVGRLGFIGGRVLEPGCGSGNFISFAPDGADITGVELDPTTATIAAALHPQAAILAESFADTRVPTGGVDLAIGNVPFGDIRLHDKRDNRGHHAIHNHFILKSLRAVRPGGLVAVITSAYTMDAANPAARREMQQMADLVGAVRLPSKAHARAAGTDALTDVLIFRRREDDREPAPFGWETTASLDVDGVMPRVNNYFLTHPQRVLGRFAVGDGLYRHDEVSVAGDPSAAPAQLRAALAEVAAEAEQSDLTMTPAAPAAVVSPPAALLPHTTNQPDGYLRANPDGTVSRLDDGRWEPYAPPKTQAGELRALLGLRDTAVALLEAEAATLDDTAEIDRLRVTLNTRYNAYQDTYGPINRFREVPARRKDKATGKMVPAVNEETGEPIMRRERPRAGGFRHDPFAPVVRALEIFDEENQTGSKADIFRQRVVAPRPPRLGADTPADALAICLDDYGEVRLDTIAWLLGIQDSEARAALGTLVFDDPATGRLEPAAAYLSGDVKTKLTLARAASDDDRYAVNVAALTEVVPRDLCPDELTIKMGAPWIDAAYVQQFLAEILDDPTVKVEYGGAAMWTVQSKRDDTVAARSTWGTDRRSAAEIAQHILEQREFVIKDTVGHGANKRIVVNIDAIMAATEKAVEMRERFADWVWEDAERAAALVAKYNDTFQRYVPRSYNDVRLSLPGLAMTFKPDPHQVAAVARIIHEPAVGLYHAVGAGKTASMIMGAMELRRLGLARKPVIIVPNQLLDQWTREFVHLYPQAKVLSAGTEDMKRDKSQDRRRLMVARMATGDWDAVILTEDAFEMLPMSSDAEQAYIDAQMAEFDERIGEARARGDEVTLKRLETTKINREARLEERLDTDQDPGIWWELTGIDYIFRDESHRDKNLRTVSNVSGMSIKGSKRAQQMDMKLAWLRKRQPRWGTRATGTPIANSIVELFTEYRFLRPDLMAALGVTDVDSFLATFAEGEVVIEVTPDGGGLRNKTRFKFVNLDELITPTRIFADVQTKDDLGLERPPLAVRADGERTPELVLVQPSDELLTKVAELVTRAADLKGRRPEKGSDNILKIVGEGAAAALDLRLVGLETDAPQKLGVAADRIAAIYHANVDRVYAGPNGQPHPTTGALQMVFCDLGTPSDKDPGRWTSYGKLRTLLAARGVPADKIRFIHDAKDDKQRAELFAACRDGRVAVLIGSTEKMGTGVNVQDRLLALHHLDCPWRPCDLEQREGRIDRRGNQNPEIHILRYVTERSLDAFRWQKVAYKARLADQVLRGQAGREADDIGEAALSYEEMKAAATGNPLLVDHAKAKADLTRLERLERGYHRNQSQLNWTIRSNRQEIDISRRLIGEATAAIGQRVDTRGDAFTMTVRGRAYTKRAEANDRLKSALGLVLADPANLTGPAVEVGQFGGFILTAKAETMTVGTPQHFKLVTGLRVALADAPGTELRLLADDLKTADLVTRLDNRLSKLETVRDHAASEITRRETEIARAEQELAKPFRHAHAFAEAKDRFQQLDIQLIALAAAADAETGVGEPVEADCESGTEVEARPGPDRGAGQAPTSVYGDRAVRERPRPPSSALASAPTVQEVLARAALPADQQRWLSGRLEQLVADPRLKEVARANDYDRARMVIDEQIPELFVDAVDATDIDGEALATRFFDNTDGWFREAFTAAASLTVYQGAKEPAAADPGTPADAQDREPDPPAAIDAGEVAGDPSPNPDRRLPEAQRIRRGHDFYPPPEVAATVPGLYATERQPAGDKVLYLHYFGGANDIWLAEYDPSTGEGFGYVCLGDPEDAEWGYVSLPELEPINRGLLIIERDLHWTPVPASQANLPGRRAPRPTTAPEPGPAPAPAAVVEAVPQAPAQPAITVDPKAALATQPAPPSADEAGTPADGTADAPIASAEPVVAAGPDTGVYHEAEARLLAATSGLDQMPSPQELADVEDRRDDPTEHNPDQPADPDQPNPDRARPAPTDLTAVPAAGTEPPAQAAPWTSRIEIVEGASLVVRGTTGAPREERLRALLKQYNFRYQRANGEWRFAGWPAARPAAVADIHRWLDTQARTACPATTLPPTEQQQRILDAAAAGKTVAVQALAGTGKTSTLLMLAAARPGARIVYVAFNRGIADEAARKFGRNVRADTSHAFAREGLSGSPLHAKLAQVGQGLRWPEDWAAHLGISAIDDGTQLVEAETIVRMAQSTVRTFRESAAEAITAAHLPRHLVEGAPGLTQKVLEYARAAWADISNPAGQLLMDHDDYLKIWALGHPRLPADLVLFDEAQDINPVLRKVIQDQPMQTIVVGDSNQSIYGFRGAVDALKHWPADVTLPLTQSWRFGQGVAAVGNRFLHLLRSPWLLTGNAAITSTVEPVEQPDVVLTRTNAGAVAAVFNAVDDGRRVALAGGGRAIQDIAQAAKDLQAGRRTKHPELSRFADWNEVRAFCEDGEDGQSLRAFVRLVDRCGADALLRMVKELIDEEHTNPDGSPAYDMIVSTVHKSKGREWDRVRIADDFSQPKKDLATQQVTLPGDEELRLAYVAVTRAKRSLELGSLAWIDDVDASDLAAVRGRPRVPEPMRAADDPTRAEPEQDDQPHLPVETEIPDEPDSAEDLDEPEAGEDRDDGPDVPDVPGPTPGGTPAPIAAQLARLDTAPGVPYGPAGSAPARGVHPRAASTASRRAGPSV